MAGVFGGAGESQHVNNKQCKCCEAGGLPNRGLSDQDGPGIVGNLHGLSGNVDGIYMDRQRIHSLDVCVPARVGGAPNPCHGGDQFPVLGLGRVFSRPEGFCSDIHVHRFFCHACVVSTGGGPEFDPALPVCQPVELYDLGISGCVVFRFV